MENSKLGVRKFITVVSLAVGSVLTFVIAAQTFQQSAGRVGESQFLVKSGATTGTLLFLVGLPLLIAYTTDKSRKEKSKGKLFYFSISLLILSALSIY